MPSSTARDSAGSVNRDSPFTVTGNPAIRSRERLQVLVGQQRRRHQHRDLLAVLHRLERRPHRDLGLAVADVAADHPVHRDRLLHVGLDLGDGGQLVDGLGEPERVLHLGLPRGVRPERVTRRRPAAWRTAPPVRRRSRGPPGAPWSWCWPSRCRRVGSASASRRRRSATAGPASPSARTACPTRRRAWLDAYSSTRYSRRAPPTVRSVISTNRPMPCWSCTTRSPAVSASGSTTLRRLAASRLPSVAAARLPVRSVSVITTRLAPGQHHAVVQRALEHADDTRLRARRPAPTSLRACRLRRAARRRGARCRCPASRRPPTRRWRRARAASRTSRRRCDCCAARRR